ncbi:MAG: type II toxin-antitoxin system RelE/ParE family toxin [Bacteroidales bacterium]|nr:type II toxin-antitoxin system RelE/ParE family toxin [Bacteroidales bacterium]
MKVLWTQFALKEVRKISNYIGRKFGQKAKQDFLQEVQHIDNLLSQMPNMGKVEPLLADLSITYRSIVLARLDKIVYYIENNEIIISDFWDMRRNPKTLANRLLE